MQAVEEVEERLTDEQVQEIIGIFVEAGAPGPGAIEGTAGDEEEGEGGDEEGEGGEEEGEGEGGDGEGGQGDDEEGANGMQYGELDGGGGHEEKEMDLEESSSKYSNDNTDDF